MYEALRPGAAHPLLHERIVIATDGKPGCVTALGAPLSKSCQTVAIGQPYVSHQHLGAAAGLNMLLHLRPYACHMDGQSRLHGLQVLRYSPTYKRVVVQDNDVWRLWVHVSTG